MKNKKKIILIVSLSLVLIAGLIIVYFVNRKKRTFVINIRIPAGSEAGIYYLDGGINCYGSKLKLKPDKNYPNLQYKLYDAKAFFTTDRMVIGDIEEIEPVEKNGNLVFDVTKNKDYKIGVYTSNDTNEDIVIYSTVYNVSMWID